MQNSQIVPSTLNHVAEAPWQTEKLEYRLYKPTATQASLGEAGGHVCTREVTDCQLF